MNFARESQGLLGGRISCDEAILRTEMRGERAEPAGSAGQSRNVGCGRCALDARAIGGRKQIGPCSNVVYTHHAVDLFFGPRNLYHLTHLVPQPLVRQQAHSAAYLCVSSNVDV